MTAIGWIVSHNEESVSTAPPVAASVLPLEVQLLVGAAVLAVLGVLVAGVIPVGLWTVIVALALVASGFLVALTLGNERIAPRAVIAVLIWVGGSVLYYLACRYLAKWWPLDVLVVPLAALVAVVLWFGVSLHLPKQRAKLFGGAGFIGPIGALAVLFAVMTSVFAAITVVAAKERLVRFTGGSPGSPSFEESARLYVWHFSNAVPLLDVNETLRWKAPLGYTSSRAGLLVLLYKIAVIVPLIGAFFFYWREQNAAPQRD